MKIHECSAAFSEHTDVVARWKSSLKDIDKAVDKLKDEMSIKANHSPLVTKEADPEKEEKSENLEAKVQSIELESNDLEISEQVAKSSYRFSFST